MTDELKYPQIMEPGALRKLNEYMISRLGTPLFFSAPNHLARPKSREPAGALYEVITGLYVIYRDYGLKILKEYLNFCRDTVPEVHGLFVFPHYGSTNKLRGGLCHGSLPQGIHIETFLRSMDYYLPLQMGLTSETVASMSDEQCKAVVNKLSSDSDRLGSYIRDCADRISKDLSLSIQWRDRLVHNVFNKDKPMYSRGAHYFDERIVLDLESKVKGNAPPKPHQLAVKNWLIALEPKLLQGSISDSNELSDSLLQALSALYTPSALGMEPSSAERLLGEFSQYF